MRLLALFLAVSIGAPAAAQTGPVEALREAFPAEHAALSAKLAGKPPEEARRIAYADFSAFLASHRARILGAPAAVLVDLELRTAALLRSVGREDAVRCALIAEFGPFSQEAAAGPPPAGLDEYAAALVAAAKAGPNPGLAAPAGREDFDAWIAAAEKIEPGVPVRRFLIEKGARAASPPASQCRAAAALHEAAARLPGAGGARMARTMVGILIAPVAEP